MSGLEVIDEHVVLDILSSTVRLVGSLLPSNIEVVLHDLRNPECSVVEISSSSITGRKKGDSVISGARRDPAFANLMELSFEPITYVLNYETQDNLGNPMRSSSVIYRNEQGMPFAALCINADYQQIDTAIAIIQQLTATEVSPAPKTEQQVIMSEPTSDNIEALLQEIINVAMEQNPGSNRTAIKKANLVAVQQMQERGIFIIKGGVEKAAKALGVSRYTVYNYLDELKAQNNVE